MDAPVKDITTIDCGYLNRQAFAAAYLLVDSGRAVPHIVDPEKLVAGRARTEKPGNDQQLAEEMERVVQAVLLCSVPAPRPGDSRYLARIFRGNAVTV